MPFAQQIKIFPIIAPQIIQNAFKIHGQLFQNVVGTPSAPMHAIWGPGRMPPEQRRRLLGSIFGPEIPENREKHHPKKHENTGTRKDENVSRQVAKMVMKWMPKRIQNQCETRWQEISGKSPKIMFL